MPMGQLPTLEVDGHRVHQSISIARYLAKRVGLGGTNDWENLIIDTVVDTVNDFRLSKYISFLIYLELTKNISLNKPNKKKKTK